METNKNFLKKMSKIIVAGGFTFFFIKGVVWIIVLVSAIAGFSKL